MKEAAIESKKGGERGVSARSVKKVTAVSRRVVFSICCSMLHATNAERQDTLAKFKG
jgi:hypothetical protein